MHARCGARLCARAVGAGARQRRLRHYHLRPIALRRRHPGVGAPAWRRRRREKDRQEWQDDNRRRRRSGRQHVALPVARCGLEHRRNEIFGDRRRSRRGWKRDRDRPVRKRDGNAGQNRAQAAASGGTSFHFNPNNFSTAAKGAEGDGKLQAVRRHRRTSAGRLLHGSKCDGQQRRDGRHRDVRGAGSSDHRVQHADRRPVGRPS